MPGTLLVAGASGAIGRRVAEAFQTAGWTVRRYQRGTDMAAAAEGAQLIFNGLNPPAYHAWARLIPEITSQVLAAARASGATVLLPGNVYVYGAQPGPWSEATPHRPCSRKGAIRATMERRYAEAAAEGVRTILLRGGDFIDPANPQTLLNMLVLKGLHKGRITAMGRPDARRSYAYLPDMARAFVALAERRAELPAFATFNLPGLRFSFDDLAGLLADEMRRPIRIKRFPWWAMRLAAPVWELARELCEMRYLYDLDHSLDGTALARVLPDFQPTGLEPVIAAHLPGASGGVVRASAHPAHAAP